MLRWLILLGVFFAAAGIVWNTRLPPSVAVDLPSPPKVKSIPVIPVVEPVIQRLGGLWAAPESHFWSDNLRVAPPVLTRDEYVPHGPEVAAQDGYTRPYLGKTRESSVWTQLLRQVTVAQGILNPGDKSFATGGIVERFLGPSLTLIFPPRVETPPGPAVEGILDGGTPAGSGPTVLDAGGATTEAPTILTGGNEFAV